MDVGEGIAHPTEKKKKRKEAPTSKGNLTIEPGEEPNIWETPSADLAPTQPDVGEVSQQVDPTMHANCAIGGREVAELEPSWRRLSGGRLRRHGRNRSRHSRANNKRTGVVPTGVHCLAPGHGWSRAHLEMSKDLGLTSLVGLESKLVQETRFSHPLLGFKFSHRIRIS